MNEQSATERIAKLRKLLEDYSFPEKIYDGMLNDIDELLTWTVRQLIAPGMSTKEVLGFLGKAFVEIAEKDGTSNWLYPCESPDKSPSMDLDGQWYYELKFKEGVLQTVAKQKWRFIT